MALKTAEISAGIRPPEKDKVVLPLCMVVSWQRLLHLLLMAGSGDAALRNSSNRPLPLPSRAHMGRMALADGVFVFGFLPLRHGPGS